jgi:uncharacterized protein (TIGR00290 family)
MTEKIILCWSGGKDSAMALYELRKAGAYEVVALLSTVTEEHDRVSMHDVRRLLLEKQAKEVGLPLEKVTIPKNGRNETYACRMQAALFKYQREGIRLVAFGDIFLEDLRRYRERNLSRLGMKGYFPLWKRDTEELVSAFIDAGFKGIVTCVDSRVLEKTLVGSLIDRKFVSLLPPSVDACGENGEYHSFVIDGPVFTRGLTVSCGEVVSRDAFYFCDLVPG